MLSIQYVFVFNTTCYIYDSKVTSIGHSSGKYIGLGLRVETRTERTP